MPALLNSRSPRRASVTPRAFQVDAPERLPLRDPDHIERVFQAQAT